VDADPLVLPSVVVTLSNIVTLPVLGAGNRTGCAGRWCRSGLSEI